MPVLVVSSKLYCIELSVQWLIQTGLAAAGMRELAQTTVNCKQSKIRKLSRHYITHTGYYL